MARNFEELEHDSLDDPKPDPATLVDPVVEPRGEYADVDDGSVDPDEEVLPRTLEQFENLQAARAQRRQEERGSDWCTVENPEIWEGETNE
jgi:hypothetical protein